LFLDEKIIIIQESYDYHKKRKEIQREKKETEKLYFCDDKQIQKKEL